VGSVVEIKLKATPGTGYQWLLKDSSHILEEIDPENLKFTNPETTKPTIGMPAQQILYFKAIKKGQEKIRFIYKRVWEEGAMESCIMKVSIE
jgi:predicted secreted protein